MTRNYEAALLPTTDSVYIELKSVRPRRRETVKGLAVDFEANGDVLGLNMDDPSRKLDMSKIKDGCPTAGVGGGVFLPSPPSQNY